MNPSGKLTKIDISINHEVLSLSLRHYLQAQSQGQHFIDSLEERGVEKGSGRRPTLKARDSAIVKQTNFVMFYKPHWEHF